MPQQDTETVTFRLPNGERVQATVPGGMSDLQAREFIRSKRPELFTTFGRATGISRPPSAVSFAGATGISTPPTLASRITGLLPAAGMTVGGVLGGSPAAALGGAAGESARQLARRGLGLSAPQSSQEAALAIAEEAALGGATEYGSKLLTRGLGAFAKGLAPVRLPSGELVHVTPGVKAGFPGPVERIAQQMLMGRPLRVARQTEQEELQSVMKNIARRAAEKVGAGPIAPAEETWRAFSNAGRAMLDTANPIYEEIKEGMRTPQAATPAMKKMVEFSRNEYLKKIIISVRAGDPRADIAPSELREDITKLASLEPLVKHGVNPEEILRQFTDVFGGGNVSVFDIFQRMRSNLLEMGRGGRLSPSDARIASGLARELNESMKGALQQTGGKDAVEAFQRANALWAQGRNLETLGRKLSDVTRGIPPSQQAAGTRAVAQTFAPQGLASQLRKSLIENYPGGASLAQEAIRDPIDRATYVQTVDLLTRSLKAGAESFAARWHGLGLLSEVGALALVGVAGHPTIALTPELGAYIVSKALTSKNGAKMLQVFLRHPVGSREFIASGARLATWALQQSEAEK